MKNERGMTLVEILAVLVLFSIVTVLLTSIFSSATKEKNVQQTEAQQIFDGAYILKRLTIDIRNATTIQQATATNKTTYSVLDENNAVLTTYTYNINGTLLRDDVILNTAVSSFTIENVLKEGTTAVIGVKIDFIINGERSKTTLAFRNGGSR